MFINFLFVAAVVQVNYFNDVSPNSSKKVSKLQPTSIKLPKTSNRLMHGLHQVFLQVTKNSRKVLLFWRISFTVN